MSDKMTCIPLDKLSADLLRSILELYRDLVGGAIDHFAFGPAAPSMELRLEWIRDGLSRCNAVEWRFGSDLAGDRTNDAKLVMWAERKGGVELVRFSFDPNVVNTPEAHDLRKRFRQASSELLEKTGYAVTL